MMLLIHIDLTCKVTAYRILIIKLQLKPFEQVKVALLYYLYKMLYFNSHQGYNFYKLIHPYVNCFLLGFQVLNLKILLKFGADIRLGSNYLGANTKTNYQINWVP